LKALGVIDKVVPEPLGGAHRDPAESAKNLKKAIQESLRSLQDLSAEELLERRQERWVNYGKFKEVTE
jgi:acetyl-CoA carboxylase carboxyl transferase subunit alpha